MTAKSDFAPEEWDLIVEAPMTEEAPVLGGQHCHLHESGDVAQRQPALRLRAELELDRLALGRIGGAAEGPTESLDVDFRRHLCDSTSVRGVPADVVVAVEVCGVELRPPLDRKRSCDAHA